MRLSLIVASLFAWATLSCRLPSSTKYVIDNEYILDSLQKENLNRLFAQHEKRTTNQVALKTTSNFYPDSTIEAYALREFNSLGIGKEGINNGVLIVFSAGLRQVRIATGYGTEARLTESIAKSMIASMVPEFKEQRYYEGLWKGGVAITTFLEKPENKITKQLSDSVKKAKYK